MKKTILALMIICTITLQSCSSDSDFNKGKQQLEQQGYTNIVNVGHVFFCCGKDDNFSTGFECKDLKGNVVKGCFCSSIGKGITVRFN